MTPHVRDEALSTKVRALSDAVETGWTTSGPLSIIDTLKAQESFILDHCIIRGSGSTPSQRSAFAYCT